MDYDKYKNKMEYPQKPIKPPRKLLDTSNGARIYAVKAVEYEEQMEAYKVARKEYAAESMRLTNQFKKDALEDVGLTGHPKADKTFDVAWEYGHADGLHSVYYYLCDLSELVLG